MSFKQALQTVYEEAKYKDEQIDILNQQNTDLQSQIQVHLTLNLKILPLYLMD